MVSEFSDSFDLENITVTLTFKKSGKLSGVFDAGTLSTTDKMKVNIGGIIDFTTFKYILDGTIEVYQRQ